VIGIGRNEILSYGAADALNESLYRDCVVNNSKIHLKSLRHNHHHHHHNSNSSSSSSNNTSNNTKLQSHMASEKRPLHTTTLALSSATAPSTSPYGVHDEQHPKQELPPPLLWQPPMPSSSAYTEDSASVRALRSI
jgi:hypothetical protein